MDYIVVQRQLYPAESKLPRTDGCPAVYIFSFVTTLVSREYFRGIRDGISAHSVRTVTQMNFAPSDFAESRSVVEQPLPGKFAAIARSSWATEPLGINVKRAPLAIAAQASEGKLSDRLDK
jgi:hypothetical protein